MSTGWRRVSGWWEELLVEEAVMEMEPPDPRKGW